MVWGVFFNSRLARGVKTALPWHSHQSRRHIAKDAGGVQATDSALKTWGVPGTTILILFPARSRSILESPSGMTGSPQSSRPWSTFVTRRVIPSARVALVPAAHRLFSPPARSPGLWGRASGRRSTVSGPVGRRSATASGWDGSGPFGLVAVASATARSSEAETDVERWATIPSLVLRSGAKTKLPTAANAAVPGAAR